MVFHLEKSKRQTAIAAGVIGNIMEWYDFALYGYMASVELFPTKDRLSGYSVAYNLGLGGAFLDEGSKPGTVEIKQ